MAPEIIVSVHRALHLQRRLFAIEVHQYLPLHLQHPVNAYSSRIDSERLQIIQLFTAMTVISIAAMRPIWIGPDLPQRIKDSDKKWAEGAKPMNVIGYILFFIKEKI